MVNGEQQKFGGQVYLATLFLPIYDCDFVLYNIQTIIYTSNSRIIND